MKCKIEKERQANNVCIVISRAICRYWYRPSSPQWVAEKKKWSKVFLSCNARSRDWTKCYCCCIAHSLTVSNDRTIFLFLFLIFLFLLLEPLFLGAMKTFVLLFIFYWSRFFFLYSFHFILFGRNGINRQREILFHILFVRTNVSINIVERN